MSNPFLDHLNRVTRKTAAIDPAVFNDPIALKTTWGRTHGSGRSNSATRQLFAPSADRLEFRAAMGLLVLPGYLVVGSVGIALFKTLPALLERDAPPLFSVESPLYTGLGLIALAVGIFYQISSPIVFDKARGRYWWGRSGPDLLSLLRPSRVGGALDHIHALQAISHVVTRGSSSYDCLELNLVLHDGARVNILAHGDMAAVQTEAVTLGEFLGVPVWDTTQLPPANAPAPSSAPHA